MNPKENTQDKASSGTLTTKELFTWKAPVRPFKRRNKEFYTTVLAVALLVGIIGFVIEGILTIVVVLSLVFLIYVLSSIEPEEVEHKITSKGVVFAGGRTYVWRELVNFWFTQRFGSSLLIIDILRLPGRLELVISPADKEKIQGILEKHIELQEATPNFLDKSAAWLSKRLPLD